MISRGKSRFDEVGIPNAELSSSADLLSELQRKQEKDSLAWDSRRQASRRLVRTPSAFSISPIQASFFPQRTFLRPRGSVKVIPARSSYGGSPDNSGLQNGYQMVRHCDQDERQSDAALHWDTKRPVLLKSVRKTWSTRFLREALASTFS